MQVRSHNFAVNLVLTVSFFLEKVERMFTAKKTSVLIHHACYDNRGSFKVRIAYRQVDNYCSEAFLEKKARGNFPLTL